MKTSIEDGVIVFLLVFICLLAGRILANEKDKEALGPSKGALEVITERGLASYEPDRKVYLWSNVPLRYVMGRTNIDFSFDDNKYTNGIWEIRFNPMPKP